MADLINPAALHQAFQPFPKLDAPLVDPETGLITQSWYFLLIRLWQMIGGSFTTAPTGAVIQQTPAGIQLLDALTGQILSGIPIPGSDTAAQIAFEALVEAIPQDLPRADLVSQVLALAVPEGPQRGPDLALMALLVPPDPKRLPIFGEMAIGAPVAITCTLQNTYYPVTGWTAKEFSGVLLSTVNSNMVVGATAEYNIECILTATPSAGGHTFVFGVFINGTLASEHNASVKVPTADIITTALGGVDPILGSQTVDIRVQCTDAAGQVITIQSADFSIFAI